MVEGAMRKRGIYWQARPKAGGKLGKWRSTRCTDLKAAQAVLAEWERSLADPTYAAKAGATLDQAGASVIRNLTALIKVGKRSEATKGYYEEKLGALIGVLGGDSLLCEITPGRVDSYVNVRRLDEVTEHTIAKELGVLRVLLKTAKRNGWWAGDTEAILPHAFGTQAKPRERFLSSLAELGKILRAIGNPDIAAQVAFSVATGAEAQAIRRAQWADLAERFVAIHGKKRPTRERMVPIVASWQATLLLYVRQNSLSDREAGNPALFVHTQGIPKALREACQKLGLPHVCPNDLRRTFNVWMDAAGVPVALRAQAMGHASTKLLDKFTYGKLSPDMLRSRMMETFSNAMPGSKPGGLHGALETRQGREGGSLPLRDFPSTEVLDGRSNGRATEGMDRDGSRRGRAGHEDGRGVDRGQEVPGGARALEVAEPRRDASHVGRREARDFGRDGSVLNSPVQVCQSGVTDGGGQGRTGPDDYTPAANDFPLVEAPRAGIEPATYGLTVPTSTEGEEG